jgi:hypothetical protein
VQGRWRQIQSRYTFIVTYNHNSAQPNSADFESICAPDRITGRLLQLAPARLSMVL